MGRKKLSEYTPEQLAELKQRKRIAEVASAFSAYHSYGDILEKVRSFSVSEKDEILSRLVFENEELKLKVDRLVHRLENLRLTVAPASDSYERYE